MKRIFLRLKQPLRNERGEITFFACFFVVGIVMLISFLLLYASMSLLSCSRFSSACKPCVWIYSTDQRKIPVCL